MGEVVAFDRITWTEFTKSLETPGLADKVCEQLSIAVQGRKRKSYKIGILAFDFARSPKPGTSAGVLHGIRGVDGKIVSHEKYPQFLQLQDGIDRPMALELAAASVLAYSWINDKIEQQVPLSRLLRTAFNKHKYKPEYPRLWYPADATGNMQTVHAGVHRFAARIALDAVGIDDIDVDMRPPLPTHIAALVDPLPASRLQQITSDILYHERGGPILS